MKERSLTKLLRHRISGETSFIQVLVGPRQVGKTTAVKSALAGRGIYETADYPTPLPHTVIEAWWDRALSHPDRLLAIDEVQKIPGWSEVVKRLWDIRKKKIKLIVTGSSALVLERGLKETLAGRYELIRAEHWNFEEAKGVFEIGLRDFIEFGCYPGSVPLLNDIERWGMYIRDSIVEPAIGRDLLQLHPVEHPALLRQLFGLAISLPAQLVSLSKLQGQLQGQGTLPTLQNYLRLFSDAFLISGIEKYSSSAFRSRKSTQKLIIHDNALLRAFERPIHQPLSEERFGRYVENQVGARFIEAGWDTFYWKERDTEVDFVVIGPQGEHYAIEVKSSKVKDENLKGLDYFCRLHPRFTPCLISLASQEIAGVKALTPEFVLSLRRKYRLDKV